MNKWIGSGRWTKEMELRYSQQGNAYLRNTLAVDRGRKDANGNKQTDFITVVAAGKTAENAANFSDKGLRVILTGQIQTGSYTDNDGKKHYTTEVFAEHIEFIDWKGKDSTKAAEQVFGGSAEPYDDSLPF